jgi:hypothetical protein
VEQQIHHLVATLDAAALGIERLVVRVVLVGKEPPVPVAAADLDGEAAVALELVAGILETQAELVEQAERLLLPLLEMRGLLGLQQHIIVCL